MGAEPGAISGIPRRAERQKLHHEMRDLPPDPAPRYRVLFSTVFGSEVLVTRSLMGLGEIVSARSRIGRDGGRARFQVQRNRGRLVEPGNTAGKSGMEAMARDVLSD